jgi:hypothetical protein
MGDVNEDGVVDATDKTWITDYIAGSQALTSAQLHAGDINSDGAVDSADKTIVDNYINHIPTQLPAQSLFSDTPRTGTLSIKVLNNSTAAVLTVE